MYRSKIPNGLCLCCHAMSRRWSWLGLGLARFGLWVKGLPGTELHGTLDEGMFM